MSTKETNQIPKLYYFTVQGVEDEEGNSVKFNKPSFGRDIEDEFDLDSIIQYFLISFYEEHKEYQDIKKWPITVKVYRSQRDREPKTVDVELSYSPVFRSIPMSIVQTKNSVETKVLETKKNKSSK